MRLLPSLVSLLFSALPVLAQPTPRALPTLTEEDLARIEKAVGAVSLAQAPRQPRHVLIFDRTEGWVHDCIPTGNRTLLRLGEVKGAFTAHVSDDYAVFAPASLAAYDAVILHNTTRLSMPDPIHRQALLDFVHRGGGLVGIHSATDNFTTWPEGQALLGGAFHGHPWNRNEVSAVKVDEPSHPLNRAFAGSGFWIREEIYRIIAPYSRDRGRVLLSLDMSHPENLRAERGVPAPGDFPISWLKNEGQGRVFYTSLGHNTSVFTTPTLLQHLADGIQFALGDLAAEAVPSGSLPLAPTPALAPRPTPGFPRVWLNNEAKSQ